MTMSELETIMYVLIVFAVLCAMVSAVLWWVTDSRTTANQQHPRVGFKVLHKKGTPFEGILQRNAAILYQAVNRGCGTSLVGVEHLLDLCDSDPIMAKTWLVKALDGMLIDGVPISDREVSDVVYSTGHLSNALKVYIV